MGSNTESPSLRGKRRWRRRLLAIGIGVTLAAIAVETGVRICPIDLPPAIYTTASLHDLRMLTQADDKTVFTMRPGFVDHPIASADFSLFHVSTRAAPIDASIGFRDDFETDAPWAALLGDSFAMGWGVEADETFASVAERELGRTILNFGVSGYGPQQAFAVMHRHALPTRPKVVIWAFYANDYADARDFQMWQRGDGMPWNHPKSKLHLLLNRYCATYKLCKYLAPLQSSSYARWQDGDVSHLFRNNWQQMLDSENPAIESARVIIHDLLAEFVSAGQQSGFQPIVIALPFREQVYLDEFVSVASREILPRKRIEATWNATIRHAESLGIPTLDLTPALIAQKHQQLFLRSDPHLTKLGNRIVGERLAAFIRVRQLDR